jgi:YidC/Oxa1 family membrane protein insertase
VVPAGEALAARRRPTMQQKNLVLFIALCMLLLFGWPWLMQRIWGPKPPRHDGQQAGIVPPGVRRDLLTQLSTVPNPAVPGIPNYLAAVATRAATWQTPSPELAWQKLPANQRESLTTLSGALAATGPNLNSSDLRSLRFLPDVAKVKPTGPAKTYVLGGTSSHFIKAVLTSRGAGVRELILTKFRAATREGRPADHQLALIQDDPVLASFLMYHYPNPDNYEPVTTLGDALWDYKGGDGNKAVFSVTLPGKEPGSGDLVITKTYTLEPGTYHLGLAVQIEHKARPGGSGEAIRFRYQIAGPHGMPIEGEWYTRDYRNPVMALVDSRNNAWREDVELGETQASVRIKEGGDRVPPGPLQPGSYLQYGGVAIQYFASLVVVDNKQPSPEQGGVDFKRILAYLRPTFVGSYRGGQEAEEQQGRIFAIRLVGDQSLVVLKGTDASGRSKEFIFRLLPRVRERLEKENLAGGSDVVVNYYTADDGTLVAEDIRKGHSLRPYTEDITVRAVSETLELKPGEKVVHQYLLYNGPVKVRLLSQFTGDEAVDPALVARYADDLHLSTLTDYRSAGPFGWFAQKIMWTDLLIQCTRLMHWLLNLLHLVVRNYGLSIILLTVLVRGLMFPISRRQASLSIKMQELAPEMKKLQEKYKDNPQARNQAVMELYRRHKVNPLGGCLPLLLQMPIFLGLYYALQESIHFRLAPFLWIPNLAAPDMLIRWGESIPWISDPDNHGSLFYLGPYFNLLPVVAVAFMIVQQKFLMPPPQDEQQAFQQKLMKYMMIFFGIMFYKVAAGLCLYFIVSSAWGLAERKLLPKRQPAGAPAAAPPPGGGGPRRASPGGNGPGPTGRGRGRTVRKEKVKEVDGPMQKVRDWWAEVLKQAKKK